MFCCDLNPNRIREKEKEYKNVLDDVKFIVYGEYLNRKTTKKEMD